MQTTPKAAKVERERSAVITARITDSVIKIDTPEDLIERYKKHYSDLCNLFNREVTLGIHTVFDEQTKKKIHKLLGEEEAGFVLWYLLSQQLVTQPIYLFIKFLQKYDVDFSLVHQNQMFFVLFV